MEKLVEVISRSQHNYRELIDNLDQAVFTLSPTGEIRVANRLVSQILGVPFHELIGHPLSEFVAEPSFEQLKALLPQLIEKGTWSGTASLRLAKESQPRIFSYWMQPILEDNRLAGVIGWARDITAQHETERNFTDLFSSLRDGIFVTTPEGNVLDANPGLIRIFGYDSKEEFLQVNFRSLYADPADRDELLRGLAAKGMIEDREVQYIRKDGKRIWCLWRGYAVKDSAGRFTRLHGMITDITERREMERRLAEEHLFVQRLIDCYPDAMLVIDSDGKFIYANKRIAALTGRDQSVFVGMEVGTRVAPEDTPRLRAHLDAGLAGGQHDPDVEYRVMHEDGNWRTFRTTVAPMRDDAGRVLGVIASTRDITQTRLAEKQEHEKDKFAAMGQMLAGAAHELNNPLTAILGVADLLRERAPDETARRHANLILQQARRASGVLQGLLAFSRRAPRGAAKVDVREILTRIVQAMQVLTADNEAHITLDIPPGLPPITGDARQLTQVFQNILTNAEQAVAARPGAKSIVISARQDGDQVHVTVTDDGVGIPLENVDKIFDPFFSTKRPGGGSGLGLTIALAVVKEHGGNIVLKQPSAGPGASIEVSLLAAVAGEPAASGSAPAAQGTQSRPAGLEGHSVLIVEDEESIREIACEGLSARGMKVKEADSAEMASQLLAAQEFDVVLCDFNLPGCKGEEFFEKLRAQRGANMPRFIFMTGALVDSDTVARFREKGARILQKPFPVTALASLMSEILSLQPVPAR